MSILSKLSVVEDQSKFEPDPILRRRAKLIERMKEQQEMAQAMIDKKPYMKYQAVWVNDEETGEKVKKNMPRKLRQWYWELDGIWYFQCSYGNRKLKLRSGKSVIKVGKLDKLVSTIGLLISAAEAGEMDKMLEDAYTKKLTK